MNYPSFQSSNQLHLPNGDMAIVKFVPLVPLMAQVAVTHMDRQIWSENYSSNFQTLLGQEI